MGAKYWAIAIHTESIDCLDQQKRVYVVLLHMCALAGCEPLMFTMIDYFFQIYKMKGMNIFFVLLIQQTTLGQVKLAVLNLAEKCARKRCPSLVDLDIFEMLSVIQVFIQEHQDICIMARNMRTPNQVDGEQSNSDRKNKLNNASQYLGRPSINLLVTSQSEESLKLAI